MAANQRRAHTLSKRDTSPPPFQGGGLLAFRNGDFIVGLMSGTIDITNYEKFIDILKDNCIEKRLKAAKESMEKHGYDTIIFPESYIKAKNRELSFESTVFAGHLKFKPSNSLKKFKFQDCRVTGNVFLDELYEVNLIEINSTNIDGKLSIQTKLGSLDLSDSTIGGSIELKKALTIDTLRIRDCEAKNIIMREVTIRRDSTFGGKIAASLDATGAKFKGSVSCNGVQFNGGANFSNAEFSKQVDFSGAIFHHFAQFNGAKFSSVANFLHATFEKKTDWDASEFEKNVTFDRVTFRFPPNFRSTTFHVTPDLHALEIINPYVLLNKSSEDTQLVPIYRHLKKLSVEANNHRGFLDHGAREVRANCLSKSIFKAMIPALYLGFSDSGRSISRPIFWLLGVIIAGALYYTSAGAVNTILVSVATVVIGCLLIWMLLLYCKPISSSYSPLLRAVDFGAPLIMLLVGVYLGITFLLQTEEALRALVTSVMASLSITQLFRLLPGGIYEAVPCGMMALTPENMDLCLTNERGEFLAMVGNKNIRFIPGAYIASGVQILISSVLLFLFGLGIRNRIKTG